ncbi:MAG: flagellar biosynthetic protein FliR [Phycisphaeraceae bacterium]|nr:flagellar biosynthetic protein FliR [Phycisphaeraceae bacterium]
MPSFGAILEHVGPFLMCLFRLSGLFVFAPVLGSPAIPARVRALVCAVFALALYPTLPEESMNPVAFDGLSLAWAVAGETLIGVVIGLLAALPMYAVQLGGMLVGHQVGVGLANVYNPALDTEADVIGQFLLYMALAVFVAIGGLEAVFIALASTFAHVPLGGFAASDAPLDLFVGLTASGFGIALRIAAPVMCIVLAETLAAGFIMKTMPQMNVLSIGFAVKIIVALIALIGSLGAVHALAGDEVARSLRAMLEWAGWLGTPQISAAAGGGA